MKKRLLSLILSAVMLLSAGCTAAEKNVGTVSDVTTDTTDTATTASAAPDLALWLADRLTSVSGVTATTDGAKVIHSEGTVVLAGAENAGSYEVNPDGLRDEGYVIRTDEDTTVIVAKTANTLDAAVRKYAIEVEKSGTYVVNLTEGMRIGSVKLGGADLGEFRILLPKAVTGDTSFDAEATKNMTYVAGELASYILDATGITLPIEYVEGLSDMTDDEVRAAYGNAILLLSDPTATGGSRFESGEMGTEDFRLTVEDGLMKIVGGNQRGVMYGVYAFLEDCVGWRFYTDDIEYLYEADFLNIDGIDRYESPDFSFRDCDKGKSKANFTKLRHNSYDSFSYAQSATYGYGIGCTFWHAHSFGYQIPELGHNSQPCLADVDGQNVYYVVESILDLANERLGAPYNSRVGYDLNMLTCAMNDNTNWCMCQDCRNYINKYSFSDLYFSFVNRVAEQVEETHPEILIYTVSYFNARKPPVHDIPRDNVVIHYCLQGCNLHEVASGECDGCLKTQYGVKNSSEYENLKGWAEITDNLYAWYYSASFFSSLTPCPNVYQMYADYKMLSDAGVDGVLLDQGEGTNNFELLKAYLAYEMMWESDITEEEFFGLIDEYLCHVYGEDAAPYIREYLDLHQAAGQAVNGCATNNFHYPFDLVDYEFFKSNYGTMQDLFDMAEYYAKDTEALTKIRVLRCHMELLGLASTYSTVYLNGSAEERAEYEESYKWLIDTLKANSVTEDWMDDWPDSYEITKNPIYQVCPKMSELLSKEGRAPNE